MTPEEREAAFHELLALLSEAVPALGFEGVTVLVYDELGIRTATCAMSEGFRQEVHDFGAEIAALAEGFMARVMGREHEGRLN